jgi:predicted cation transporter
MHSIPNEPVLFTTAGLTVIAGLILLLPFLSRKVEENLEPFFLAAGLASLTVSGLWSWRVLGEALRAPVMVGGLPLGIFQIVLVVGLMVHYFNAPFSRLVLRLAHSLGHRLFLFCLISVFGLLAGVVSVIIVASLLSEIAAVLPFSRKNKIRLVVITCFAAGLGACLTPLGEPLSTIMVAKLAGPPYHAGFLFPLKTFGVYVIPGVLGLAAYGASKLGPAMSASKEEEGRDVETPRTVVIRAVRVYVFIASLVFIGEGFRPLMEWYLVKVPSALLYWINTLSAVLDNATLTAIEVGPAMTLGQIKGIIVGLLIAGGMLIPGNIPNIVAAARLKIKMKDWAAVGLPLGGVLLAVYFVALYFF